MATAVRYDTTNATRLLEGTGIECPRCETYVEALVAFAREKLRKERPRQAADEAPDPHA